jgi:Protein of unknown function (DUF3592)
MATNTDVKLGAGCLALFALPFAAVGVAALYLVGSALLTWYDMRSWTEVRATLERLELEQHTGDDATTYEVAGRYRYRYGGRDYSGDRVAISGFADNIGDFHQDLYAALSAAERRGDVTAFVDPDDPTRATLNRDMRWGLLAFQGVFALVFGGAGFGLLIGARVGGKKLAEEHELKRRFPNEPWRWRKQWASARIQSSNRATAYAAAGFALLWNLISIPATFVVPREVAAGHWLALAVFLFPLIGVGLAVWAIRAWRQLRRFRVSTLELARVPVALGGPLRGTVRVETEVPVATEFRVELSCVEHTTRTRGGNSESSERLLWQGTWTVPRRACQISSSGTTIPIDVPVPADQPASGTLDDGERVTWRLDVSGECSGPDYWSRFDVPAFDVAARDTGAVDVPAPEAPAVDARARDDAPLFADESADDGADAAAPSSPDRPDRRKLESLGIAYEQLPNGEAWTFRRAQHKKVAAMLTVMSAVWTAITIGLFWSDAPALFPIVFGLFDLIFVWWTLSLWFTEYRVTLDHGMLTIVKRGFGGGAPVEIPYSLVRGVRAQRGMQAGNKLYYDLKIETDETTHTAASSLADYSVAAWLADYWMRGGAAGGARSRRPLGHVSG